MDYWIGVMCPSMYIHHKSNISAFSVRFPGGPYSVEGEQTLTHCVVYTCRD